MSLEEEHDYLAAEARARKKIDEKLVQAGWKIQDRAKANLYAGQGVALREFVHGEGHGRSDYALYVDRQLVGVLEAKPDGTTLTEVERQTRKYIDGVPDAIPAPVTPLPFGYEATGTESRFTCFSDPEPRSRRIFGGYIHRPETLAKWLARITTNQEAPTVRAGIRAMPALNVEPLWDAQVEAIQNTEQSLRENRPRALIQMATGSGKTYTAATLAYRLIEYADAARILFLVDRRNLGRQAKGEFQRFDIPGSSRKFAEVYNIQHLAGPRIDKVSRVCISTVQRMYSILRGTDIDAEIDARSLYELQAPPEPIAYNPDVPPETFDFIVVDECHRSIFGVWRQVLEYFDAFIIGLSATPNQQALAPRLDRSPRPGRCRRVHIDTRRCGRAGTGVGSPRPWPTRGWAGLTCCWSVRWTRFPVCPFEDPPARHSQACVASLASTKRVLELTSCCVFASRAVILLDNRVPEPTSPLGSSMLHITLTPKKLANDPTDPLGRTFYGWGQQDTIEENWQNNRGYWVLGARAHRESYVLFSHNERHEVVMAARIDKIIDAPGKPGRKIIEGEPLPKDHAVYQAYVGQPTPPSARVRNPVTYFDSTVGGWPCGCGCGEEIFVGEFVRGHEQTALHQRVAQIGTIPEFLRWFDAVRAGTEPAAKATTPAPVSRTGQFDLSIGDDGSVRIHFTPTDELVADLRPGT